MATKKFTTRKAVADSHNVDIINGEQDVNLDKGVRTGFALSDDDGIEIDVEQVMRAKELEFEKFMRDPIEIHLHDAGSEDEAQYAEVTVDGRREILVRGQSATVSRAHVATLARAKQQRLSQEATVNPDGSRGFKQKVTLKLVYPFSVTSDPAGAKGAAWIRQLMASPA